MKGKNFPIHADFQSLLSGLTGEVSPEVEIRAALAEGRRLTGAELRQETGLGDRLYPALGSMYERGEVRTSGEGLYWLDSEFQP